MITIPTKWQKLILLSLLIIFAFSLGFLLGNRIYSENPVIINCK